LCQSIGFSRAFFVPNIDLRADGAQLPRTHSASWLLRRTGAGPYFSLLGGTAEQAAEKV